MLTTWIPSISLYIVEDYRGVSEERANGVDSSVWICDFDIVRSCPNRPSRSRFICFFPDFLSHEKAQKVTKPNMKLGFFSFIFVLPRASLWLKFDPAFNSLFYTDRRECSCSEARTGLSSSTGYILSCADAFNLSCRLHVYFLIQFDWLKMVRFWNSFNSIFSETLNPHNCKCSQLGFLPFLYISSRGGTEWGTNGVVHSRLVTPFLVGGFGLV